MRRGNPHSARSLSFYSYCHPPHLRNVALHHPGLPSPHRGMTTVPPPRLSADTAAKRRGSPDKLPHCLMQTVIARHVKFIRKLRIYIRNLRLYILKFRLYIRNLRLYFAIGDSEVYVRCPGSLPALPAGLQTVTAGNMCIAGRVADRTAALARCGKKPGGRPNVGNAARGAESRHSWHGHYAQRHRTATRRQAVVPWDNHLSQ